MPEISRTLEFWINGERHCQTEDDVNPNATLLEYLREEAMLHGTKLGCGTGGCGACTVIVSRMEPPPLTAGAAATSADNNPVVPMHRPVNACITPLCHLDGAHVLTVEGVGDTSAPHVVQQRLADMHGSQCGFCTPGFVMSLFAALANHKNKPHELEVSLEGRLRTERSQMWGVA